MQSSNRRGSSTSSHHISNPLLSRRAERLYFQVNMRLRIFGGFPPMSKLICTLLEQRCAKRCCVAECCLGPLALRRAYFGFLVLPHTKEVYGKEWRSKSDSPSNSRCFVQNKETHVLWLLWPPFLLYCIQLFIVLNIGPNYSASAWRKTEIQFSNL